MLTILSIIYLMTVGAVIGFTYGLIVGRRISMYKIEEGDHSD